MTGSDVAIVALFPCVATAGGVRGIESLFERRPEGNLWLFFLVVAFVAAPALLLLMRRRERALVLAGWVRAQEAEERVSLRDRELDAVAAVSDALARTHDPAVASRRLLLVPRHRPGLLPRWPPPRSGLRTSCSRTSCRP